jgi:DNA-binding CsgD family transcriptional regulator
MQLLQKINRTNTPSISMRLRLFLFLLVLVLTMVTGIVVILLVTGTFTAGMKENKELLQSELEHVHKEISAQYGPLSIQAVEFSKELSKQIEHELDGLNTPFSELDGDPEKIEEVILNLYEFTYYSLEKSKCSGAFLILNTTVNPDLDNAENSRSGLYIKNMEPNIISSSSPMITILRGFSSIGRENSINLHTQWRMEFDISEALYYTVPQKAYTENKTLSLSKLYYWTGPILLPGTSEEVMICSVPIMDSQNNLYGVCGFEISTMLFKLSHMPNNHKYSRMFCMLSPITEETLDIKRSMFAGGYSAKNISEEINALKVTDSSDSFTTYSQGKDIVYVGFHAPIQLYPEESPFFEENWATAVLVPKEDIADSITRLNLVLISLLSLLVTFGVIISIVFSNKYLKPISEGIEIIKTYEPAQAPKTNVAEIDDLIHHLSLYKMELNKKAEQDKHQLQLLEQFVEKTKTLTPAERSVFNLYIQGLSAKEIADQMFLSINTIKTHNKRIYSKLNITSREELLLYINMLKEIGQELK